MKKQGLLGDQRFLFTSSLMLVFAILVALSRVLLAKNSQMITVINDAATVFCALVATIFFMVVWLSTSSQDISKKIWGLIVAGLIAWTIAEATWAYYEAILEQEVPYPGPADLFWLFGYFIVYVALVNQYRLFQTSASRRQKTVIVSLVLLFSLIVSVFVLKPILDDFDPQNLLESLLNVAYPLSDLILLTLTLAIIFSLEQGRFAFTWRLLGLGLVFMALGDLMFSYASLHGTYDPETGLNAVTLLVDSLYYIAYLTLGLGAYTYKLTSDSLQPVGIDIVLRSLTKSNILVFVGKDGRIISLSDNFANLVRSHTTGQFLETRLNEALKVNQAVMEDFIQNTLRNGFLSVRPLIVRDLRGDQKEIWITALAIYDDRQQFVCIAVVLRTNLDVPAEEERPLSEEQELLIRYYLTQTGTYRSEENQVLKTYFLGQLRLLYSLTQQFSGTSVADKLLTYLSQVAGQNDWHFAFTNQQISIPEEYEGEVLGGHLSILLHEAKNFAVNVINLKVVEHEMKILDNNLSTDSLGYLDKYGLRNAKTMS